MRASCPRYLWVRASFSELVLIFWFGGPPALSGQPGQAGDLAAQAEAAMRAGRLDIAESDYEKAAAVQPGSAQLWSNLGTVRVMQGHCLGALPALARARRLDPGLYTPWYFSGFCHLQLHQKKAALTDLDRAVRLNPRDANAWYIRARAAADLDRLDLAFASAVQGIRADPNRPELYMEAGRVALDLATECYRRTTAAPGGEAYVFRLEGERNAAQGIPQLAVDAYEKEAARAPEDPDVAFGLGMAYLALGRLADAERECRRAVRLAPESSWAKIKLAAILAREGKSAEAVGLAAALDPRVFESREEFDGTLNLAAEMKNSELGERALARGLAVFPGDPELAAWSKPGAFSTDPPEQASGLSSLRGAEKTCMSVRFLVLSYRDFSSLHSAAAALNQIFSPGEEYSRFRSAFLGDDFLAVGALIAPKLNELPHDAGKAFVLGQLLHWLSFEYDRRLETGFPDSEAAQVLVAENLTETSQPEKAIAILQALISKDGNSPDLMRALARVYWTRHQWDEALQVLEKVHKADPGDATTMVNIGRIYSYRQDLENASRSFVQALEADPKSFEAHLGLGEAYHREGATTRALGELKAAEQLDPTNPRPHYILAQLYSKLGERPSADREMAEFQRLQSAIAVAKTHKTEELVPID
jgi:tetratricopeptide (TPR) repeat protein